MAWTTQSLKKAGYTKTSSGWKKKSTVKHTVTSKDDPHTVTSKNEPEKDIPNITRTNYKVTKKTPTGETISSEKVSKETYEERIAKIKAGEKGFTETHRDESTGATTGREYDPKQKKYFDINPVTGVRRVTKYNYKIGGKPVSKEEYDLFIEQGLKKGKSLKVTTTKPVDVINKSKEPTTKVEEKPYWDWQKQLADKYSKEHPNMKTYDYYVSTKDDKGNIVGYEDKLNKQSVMLKPGESITEESLRKASKQTSALLNIEEDKKSPVSTIRSKESYEAEEKARKPKTAWWDFSTKLKDLSKSSEQKYKEAYSVDPLLAGVYASGAFSAKIVKQFVDMPKNLITIGIGSLYGIEKLGEQAVLSGVESFRNVRTRLKNYEALTGEKPPKVSVFETFKASSDAAKAISLIVGGVSAVAVAKGKEVVEQGVTEATTNPVGFAGDVTGVFLAPTLWGKTFDVVKKGVTTGLAKAGLKYRDPATVFSAETLGKGELPKTKSSAETLALLEKTRSYEKVEKLINGKWVSATPDEIAGLPVDTPTRVWVSHISTAEFGKSGKFIAGPKGAGGLEDPVVYVTTAGHLSNLRLGTSYDYSFKPFSWAEGKSTPKGYEFSVKGGSYIPDEVLASPGFGDDLAKFYAESVGDEMAYITKRSMIGKGEVAPQYFTVQKSFEVPTASLTVTRGGKIVKLSKGQDVLAGDILRTAGTGEEELGIAAETLYSFGEGRGNVFQKLLNAESYTKFDDQLVLLSKGRTLPGGEGVSNVLIKSSGLPSNVMSASDIAKESARSISGVGVTTIYVDPVSMSAGVLASLDSGVSVQFVSSFSGGVSPNVLSSSPVSSSPKKSDSSVSMVSESSILSPSVSSSVSRVSKSSRGGESSSTIVSSPSPSIISSPSPSAGSSAKSSSVSKTSPYISQSIIESTTTTPMGKISLSKKKGGGLFEVKVRKRGKWVVVDKGSAFSFSEAKQRGMVEVGTTARASFKIEPTTGKTKKRFFGKGMFGDFYKKGNVFIEKRGRRIKSKGELEQITYKGQRAIKSKSIMSKMKMF